MKKYRQGEMNIKDESTASCCHVMKFDSVKQNATAMYFSRQMQGGDEPGDYKIIRFPLKRKKNVVITQKI